MQEKRQHPRAMVNLDLTCESKDHSPVAGVAKDISIGGMFIESEGTLPFGTNVTILMTIPGIGSESRLPAVVRWSKPGGFGVQFGLLGARETHAITRLLK